MARANKDFERSLAKYVKKVDKVGTKGIRSVALVCLKSLMMKSPVDEGTFRANWNVGVNNIDESTKGETGGTVKRTEKGKATKKAIDPEKFAEGEQRIGGIDVGNSVNISNALPYAMRLEKGDSKQASAGIVTPTLIQVKNELDRQNKKV